VSGISPSPPSVGASGRISSQKFNQGSAWIHQQVSLDGAVTQC
jgi:hypothetical protein